MLRCAAGHGYARRQSCRSRSSAPAIPAPTRAHNRYNIAPEELIRIQRQARKLGLDIVGFYHSHPDHPAQWSQTDFAEAHWVGCSYVITACRQGKAAITNSFLLTGTSEEDKQFLDEPVEIEVRQRDAKRARERPGMKIHIPTPLRAYTGGQQTVSVPGATVGEALEAARRRISRSAPAPLYRRGQAALFRQSLPQRRRHPLPAAKGSHAGHGERRADHHSLHRGRLFLLFVTNTVHYGRTCNLN